MTKKAVLTALLCIIIAVCTITTTFAWLVDQNNINPGISGGGFTGYFYAGDGKTPETAYQIKDPIHVYNLAWLQYMGLLNKDDNGNVKQLYFELVDDIDMTGVVLPPIGTTENPFIGHFDGNGYCISNLTVSNYLQGSIEGATDGIVNRPLSVVTIEGKYVSIVGFFGVVGDINGNLGLADDSTVEGIENKVNAVHDLFLDKLTIRTETKETLVGLFAGYVNGSISNIGIANGDIIIGDQVYPLTSETALEMGQIISMYSLIGKYDSENVEWKDDPFGDEISGGEIDPDNGGGFGGSLDMMELNMRLSYILGAASQKSEYSPKFTEPFFGFVGYYSGKNIPYQKSGQVIYFSQGTIMPILVNSSTMFAGGEKSGNNSSVTTTYYQTSSSESISPNNVGYYVGGGKSNSSSNAYMRLRAYSLATGSSNPGIYKSIGTTNVKDAAFNKNTFQMLTITPDGTTYIITDDTNRNASTYLSQSTSYSKAEYNSTTLNLQRYIYDSVGENGVITADGVKTQLCNTLEGQTLFHGIHFMKKIKISNPEVTEFDAYINGVVREGYEGVDGGINFTVNSAGYITAIAGTNYSTNGTHSLFTLFHVTRENNKVTTLEIINTIHKVYDSTGKLVSFEYNTGKTGSYEENGYTYKIAYNKNTMNSLAEVGAAYYFEIPVMPGEYVIGCDNIESKDGAYLMYLDIGANGNLGFDTEGDNGGSGGTTAEHSIEDIKFVESSYIKETEDNPGSRTTEGYPVITFEIKLEAGTNTSGLHVSYVPSDTDVSITVTDLSTPPKTTTEFAVTQKKKE